MHLRLGCPGWKRASRSANTIIRWREITTAATDLRLPRRPFRVVANPPFSITTALIRRLLSGGSRLVTADLVVPRHVAVRWARGRAPGADRWRRTFGASVSGRLPSTAFRPRPPGPIAVLRVERRQM